MSTLPTSLVPEEAPRGAVRPFPLPLYQLPQEFHRLGLVSYLSPLSLAALGPQLIRLQRLLVMPQPRLSLPPIGLGAARAALHYVE